MHLLLDFGGMKPPADRCFHFRMLADYRLRTYPYSSVSSVLTFSWGAGDVRTGRQAARATWRTHSVPVDVRSRRAHGRSRAAKSWVGQDLGPKWPPCTLFPFAYFLSFDTTALLLVHDVAGEELGTAKQATRVHAVCECICAFGLGSACQALTGQACLGCPAGLGTNG